MTQIRPTGWNNVIFANVAMPRVLCSCRTSRSPKIGRCGRHDDAALELAKPGKAVKVQEYDKAVADLVSFLVWMGEPVAEFRKKIGALVPDLPRRHVRFSLSLKKNYWKDIH